MDKVICGNFRLGSELQECVVDGTNVYFRDPSSQTITSIDGLKLSKAGVLKEFPDLKDDVEWQRKAKERFKEHIKKFQTEKDKLFYIKDELIKYGYTALFYQRAGHRPQKWKQEEI